MNERIKALVEKAGAKELGADLYGGEFIGAVRLDFLEKFAELIVLECARVVKASSPQGMIGVNAIRIHFGVEP